MIKFASVISYHLSYLSSHIYAEILKKARTDLNVKILMLLNTMNNYASAFSTLLNSFITLLCRVLCDKKKYSQNMFLEPTSGKQSGNYFPAQGNNSLPQTGF